MRLHGVLAALSLAVIAGAAEPDGKVTVNWDKITRVSKTTATPCLDSHVLRNKRFKVRKR